MNPDARGRNLPFGKAMIGTVPICPHEELLRPMNTARAKTLRDLGCCVAAIAGAVFLSVTGVQARNGADIAGQPQTTRFILADSAGSNAPFPTAGLQIAVRGTELGEHVLPEDNPISGASGFIADAHAGFCDCIHYHGTLFGAPDPDEEHCGWGCLILVGKSQLAMVNVSDATMLEVQAGQKALAGDLDGAIADFKASKEKLKSALENQPEVGDEDWDSVNAVVLEELIEDTIKLDNQAVGRLKKAKNAKGQARAKLIRQAGKLGTKALAKKQAAAQLLAEELNLIPEED
jgi:hypothetical protein